MTPKPSGTDEMTATWEGGTSLDGFKFVAEAGEDDDAAETAGNGVGFGAGLTVVALAGVVLLARLQ